ncbi:hypothetical protein E2C01_094260 [Portunus trituberculatus]|uniref:Uncharacterized protein n=1 Tax=Portunus trituberculatus TaxID=210409 RepID=A0A5B7K2M6_PORTR|nr:hypothetical protein [Portunus trituberculatus]
MVRGGSLSAAVYSSLHLNGVYIPQHRSQGPLSSPTALLLPPQTPPPSSPLLRYSLLTSSALPSTSHCAATLPAPSRRG